MRRSKQVEALIADVNDYLRYNEIKDESNPVFSVVADSLLRNKLYMGYNYYRYKYTETGRVTVLAGSGDPSKFDFLQIY